MAFQNNPYESDQGITMLYRCSDEEAAAVAAAAGPVDVEAHAYSSGGRKRFGIHTRGVNLSRVVGSAPNTFKKTSFLAIPTVAEYDGLSTTDTVSVGGVTWNVSSKQREDNV